MAKINHNDPFATINNVIENAKIKQAIHLYAEGEFLTGDSVTINGKKLWHFATTGYLGLEQDPRLKHAAASAIYNYGTQFPLSKTYISHPLYAEIEIKVNQIFGQLAIITKNSTLAHVAVIPQAVSNNDVVILDHQVHWSVQNACQNLKLRGIPVYMIRHNNMDQLESYLEKFGNKYSKIWYMADGIYSMFGDFAPVKDIKFLMSKYPLLHLYFDDVHGMSWVGEKGSGFIKSHWDTIPERMILVSTLSKTFGASGGLVLCGNLNLQNQIKNFGGPLTFSAQLEPASVAAAIASADIHLSSEIEIHQNKLLSKIELFYTMLRDMNLPVISHGKTPVFYIGTGLPETAYNMVNRLKEEGFFVNPGIYPAVPLRNAGLRITISNHNEDEQIKALAHALNYHLDKALNETDNSLEKVYKLFNKTIHTHHTQSVIKTKQDRFNVEIHHSIKEINKEVWNKLLGKENALDYCGMTFVEDYFSSLPMDNNNHMNFKYLVVKDENNNIVALTHFSLALWKEDMLSRESVSKKIENIRKSNPEFLIDKVISTGSTFTEGCHIFIDYDYKYFKELTNYLFDILEEEYQKSKSGKIVLRDFEVDHPFSNVMIDKGYLSIEMPDSAIFDNFNWNNIDEYENTLTKRSKRHFRQDVLPYAKSYLYEVCNSLNEEDLMLAYQYYKNVKNNNKAINNFMYDYSLFEKMNNDDNWNFFTLREIETKQLLGVLFCYRNKTNNSYCPLLIGMPNLKDERLKIYRQLMFQVILYAKKKNYNRVYLGLSATFEKRKLGAKIYKKNAFVHFKDNYLVDLLQNFE